MASSYARMIIFSCEGHHKSWLFCYYDTMKVTWSPALTLDGFIAKLDGDSDWVTDQDGELFHELVRGAGCVIVGRKTYEQYKGQVFPIEGAVTFVWTRHPETSETEEGVEHVTGHPKEVISLLESKGFTRAVLAGGGKTNTAFVSAGFVDEINATVYPLLFGTGIRLLATENLELKLQLIGTQGIGDGVVRHTYKVLR